MQVKEFCIELGCLRRIITDIEGLTDDIWESGADLHTLCGI